MMKNLKSGLMIALILIISISLTAAADYREEYLAGRIRLFTDLGILADDFSPGRILTEEEFSGWLERIFAYQAGDEKDLDGNNQLSYLETAFYLLNALGQKEFVLTYPDDLPISDRYWQAADIIDIFADLDHLVDKSMPVRNTDGLTLLTTAMERAGIYRLYTGDLQEASIYGKLETVYQEILTDSILNDAQALFKLGNKGLLTINDGSFTGYSVKDLSEQPIIFDPATTIRYGHSSKAHLLQLISVLKREGFQARIHLESRTSSYIHLRKEWGEPADDVKTTPINQEKCVVHATEYDLLIEFASFSDKLRLGKLIREYAKKESKQQQGLIRDSWFVPLFTSTAPLPGFYEVAEIRGIVDGYAVVSYALPEKALALKNKLQQLNSTADYTINPIWINQEFLSYLDASVE